MGVACKGYDIEIDVIHTAKEEFKKHIPRKQIPGLNKFFDMKVQGDYIKILSARDEEFFLDKVSLKEEGSVIDDLDLELRDPKE